MTANTPKGRIQKGKDLENFVAELIRSKGLDPKANRSFGSGNGTKEKADIWTSMQILGQNAGIEAKHVSNVNFKEFWKQTQKLEKLGREPVLVIKLTSDDYADAKAVIYLDTLLELVKQAQTGPEGLETAPRREKTPELDKSLKYDLERLKYAISAVTKRLK